MHSPTASPPATNSLSATSAPASSEWEIRFLSILRCIDTGSLSVITYGGQTLTFRGSHPGLSVKLTLHAPDIGKAVALRGALGFAETYIDGKWSTPDLPALLHFFLQNIPAIEAHLKGSRWQKAVLALLHWWQSNTRRGSRKNIASHYDIGNAFYETWLDSSMTYSSALFSSPHQTLEEGQNAKYQRILDQLPLQPKQSVLEIGCGWGGFLEKLCAQHPGVRGVGLTLSHAQADYARQRLQLIKNASVIVEDYRDHRARYDHIVSIEMLEAVGRQYWPLYFRRLKETLRPGGRVVLQSIIIDERYYRQYARSVDFIQAHVFPGGMLPTLEHIDRFAGKVFLRVTDTYRFGLDYAATLDHWHERFDRAWPRIEGLNPRQGDAFDGRFKRLWEYYLAYCRAGFLTGRIDVVQVTLAHTANT